MRRKVVIMDFLADFLSTNAGHSIAFALFVAATILSSGCVLSFMHAVKRKIKLFLRAYEKNRQTVRFFYAQMRHLRSRRRFLARKAVRFLLALIKG